jgi:hypothetical protein
MARDKSSSSGDIFFPWERRGGLRRWLATGRVRHASVAALVVGFVAVVAVREQRQAGVRQTRATLLSMRQAVDAYLSENDGACPAGLEQVLEHAPFKKVPSDAWGNPLRIVCPSRRPDERYELLSDGPDGKPGGLDRIE